MNPTLYLCCGFLLVGVLAATAVAAVRRAFDRLVQRNDFWRRAK